jgi:hypothetical protein
VISGTVYDSSKVYNITGVSVYSTSGSFTQTDSVGVYHIKVNEQDSIFFFYNRKPTAKFPVKNITNYNQFDISLRVTTKEKYKSLKEVIVYGRSHKQDSLENRETYATVFNYKKPSIQASVSPSGGVGFDLDELINMFRFRRNKELKRFQNILVDQEHDNYVNYRFNSYLIKRITGLDGDQLEKYKKKYRPTYEYVLNTGVLQFYQYIINTSTEFKLQEGIK